MSRRWLDLITGSQLRPTAISRRQLLRMGLAAGMGLLSNQSFGGNIQKQRPRILIVGAGFAGLACAFELVAAGYEVQVLEARKRIGGRVHSLRELIPGKSVEGGAEFLGANHPHALAYAAKFGFQFWDLSEPEGIPTIVLGGKQFTGPEIAQATSEIDAALTLMTNDARAVVLEQPWLTADAKRLDQLSTAAWINRLEMSAVAKALMTVQLTANNGVATDRQSYLGNLAQVRGGGLEKYWTDTEAYRLQGGNQQYAERMAKELGPGRVQLNCPAREVIGKESSMIVVDGEGRRYEADDVVLAVPPSAWGGIKFSPGLPEALNPQMGMNVKYLSVVKERFWQAANLTPQATTDQEISHVYEGTAGQGTEGPAALVAFSGGPPAEVIHKRPVAERQPAYLKSLEVLFPGFGEQFVKGQFMDWIGDPWTRAGYSFPAPGQVTTVGPALRAGIGHLHFIGEHTCYEFVGYMEGALKSGASLAKRFAMRDGLIAK
ncbi:MAG: puo 2 [Schlesneria sp.]|nr:puo 2 [Schlesneria sp.]